MKIKIAHGCAKTVNDKNREIVVLYALQHTEKGKSMDIRKLLLTVAVRFEELYKKWMTDDEPFDAAWMDPNKWKATKS